MGTLTESGKSRIQRAMILLGFTALVISLMAVVVQASDIFSDDFETGDLSKWDTILAEGGNTVEVSLEAAHNPLWGLHIKTLGVEDDARVGKEIDPTNQLYTKIWVNLLNHVTLGYHQQFQVLASHQDDSNAKIGLVAIRRSDDDNANNLYALPYPGTGTQPWTDTGFDFPLGEWHCLEMYVSVHPVAGELKVWFDGNLVSHLSSVDTGTSPITHIRLGADGTEVEGEYYFDDFASSDSGRIACGSEPPTVLVDARTIGYWKVAPHEAVATQVLTDNGPFDLGDEVVTTYAELTAVLDGATATDMKDQLRAQLLAAILNIANGAHPSALGYDITPIISSGITFLAEHSGTVPASHPDRPLGEAIKDALDAYNNSGE
jgi:hypothetical protein